MKEKALFVQII